MIRRSIVPALVLVALALTARQAAAVPPPTVPINFTRGLLAGAGFTTSSPTAMAIGPDGRLYVANSSGIIQALTIGDGPSNTKVITAVQQVTTAAMSCLTSPQPPTCMQEVFGIAFDPLDNAMYVTNTISGFGGMGQAPAGSFPGKITKFVAPGYTTRSDVITGLPISNSGHEANDLAFGPDGRLYIEQGSSTNAGVVNPISGIFQLPDTPLSGAVLVADVHAVGFNGNITYSPPNTYSSSVAQAGGFGVSVYASGFRNPYGLVWHSNGKLYATDNGPNAGYGPASVTCSTDTGVDAAGLDELDLVVAGKYYGHANRNRGNFDARQCLYHFGTEPSTVDYTAPIESNLPASSDGMAEYTSSKFGAQMQGDLLYAAWVNSELHRVKLSADGQSVVYDVTLATGLQNALDVSVGADGSMFVAEFGGNRISFFRPNETPVTSISVTAIQPAAGPLAGGQAVTITGTNFTTSAETVVTIGGQAATNVVVQNSTTITALTPPNTAGLKGVTVTNSIGTATLAASYNYAAGGGTVPPVANAGPDITSPVSHLNHAHVNLDGRASFDPDGFIASYNWSENGSTLSTLALDTIEFTLGTHLITLTTTDNDGLTGTDQVRVTVTSGPSNPTPYYCFDVNGDHYVNVIDLQQIAGALDKKFGDAGYTRLKDRNADRYINVLDLQGTATDMMTYDAVAGLCPLVDQQLRTATAAMEQYQNINAAIAAGFVQVTPFVPTIGRHMIRGVAGGLNGLDTVFDPADPEALLYEPDSKSPGGWRLGGAMYIIPITKQPQVPVAPQSFATTDAAWHVHDGLCIWNNANSVQENTTQADCLSRPGNPNWSAQAGWLLHVWNFTPNASGRFVENNTKFVGLP